MISMAPPSIGYRFCSQHSSFSILGSFVVELEKETDKDTALRVAGAERTAAVFTSPLHPHPSHWLHFILRTARFILRTARFIIRTAHFILRTDSAAQARRP